MKRPTRIAIITTDARHRLGESARRDPNFGTAIRALLQGFEMLEEVEVHVISASPVHLESPAKLAGNIWFHHLAVPKLGWGKTLFAGCVLAIRKCLDEIQPDIVHGQGTERDCAIAAVLSGYPNVLTIHGNMRVHARRGENRNKPYYKLAALLEGFAVRRTDGVVCISSYTRELVEPSARQCWLLPNATESSYFNAKPAPEPPLTLLFIGALDERKNPIGYIKACGKLISENGWRMRLCGEGNPDSPYMVELRQLAAEYPWIELPGWVSRENLLSEMEKAGLLVLPTLEDNCPMVVLEAMSAGLPVIASRVGGVPDLISEGKTGMMFDPLDPESMRNATKTLIADPGLRARIAAAARTEANERFHPRSVAEAHMKIYREVLGNRA